MKNQIKKQLFLYLILSCGYISPESTKKVKDDNLCNGITCKVNDPNTKTTNTKNTDVQSIPTVDDFKYEATDSDFAVSKTLVGPFILNDHCFRGH